MDSNPLIYRLQLLQRRLCEMANELDRLTDPEIVAVSEEADRLIIQLQRLRRDEEARKRSGTVAGEEQCASTPLLPAASKPPEEIREQRSAWVTKHTGCP